MSRLFVQKDSRLCVVGNRSVLVTLSPARTFGLRSQATQALVSGMDQSEVGSVCADFWPDTLRNAMLRYGVLGIAPTNCRLIAPSGPSVGLQRIFLELTSACNLRCKHCYISSSPDIQRTTVDTARWIDVIEQASVLGACQVDLTGGEPLVHPGIWEIIECLRDKAMLCTLFTNGTLLREEGIRRLKETGCIRAICISVDSHLPVVHDRFRGQKGAFARVMEALQWIRAAGLDVYINVSVHEGNAESLDDIDSFLQDMDIPYRIAPPLSLGRAGGMACEQLRRLFVEHVGRDWLSQAAEQVGGHQDLSAPSGATGPRCGVGTSMLFVDSNGTFGLCPTLSAREDARFNLGSITSDPLARAWQKARNIGRVIDCRYLDTCPVGQTCRGGCRSRAFLEGGQLDSPDPLCCEVLGIPPESQACGNARLDANGTSTIFNDDNRTS